MEAVADFIYTGDDVCVSVFVRKLSVHELREIVKVSLVYKEEIAPLSVLTLSWQVST